MSVIAYKLVKHEYDQESLYRVFSVNELKGKGFEWNEESNRSHPINEEISAHDYVYSIQNIGNTRDEYGYCFIDERKLDDGNYLYTLDGFILDTDLPESVIGKFVSVIIGYLNQLHREDSSSVHRTDRVIGIGIPPLPLAQQFLERTKATICSEVVRSFMASREGFVALTASEEARLKEIAGKMGNAPGKDLFFESIL
jgi:hypothetical protein